MPKQNSLKNKVEKLPLISGAYIFKDTQGKIIYVGKAKSLKKRVQSYFSRLLNSKTQPMVAKIADIEYITTSSDGQALLLEAELIKKYKPKYNVELRDDKSYPLIKISSEQFPAIFICRPRRKDKARYFGPYTNAKELRELLKTIRSIFGFRSCRKLPKKACLYFYINLCPAPCINKIPQKDYRKKIKNIILILEGKYEELLKQLTDKMRELAEAKRFEEAARLRNQIIALGNIYSGSGIDTTIGEIQQLKDALRLPTLPLRIEAFDVSNIFGNQAVGSMVSFWQGKPDKNNYRRFRIKEVSGIDDYKMLAEITRRRYKRVKEERLNFPDLIVIDGGKGQLNAVKDTLRELGLDIPTISIAKQNEEIFAFGRKKSIILDDVSPALKLIRRVRDEAHRFALAYHHILRRKKIFEEK